jgi:ketosteroid isomerase-like protein
MLSSKSATSIAHAFAKAINSNSIADLAELMTEDHAFVDALGSRIEGKQNMLKAWEGYFRMVPDYSITIDESFADGSSVVMVGKAQGTYAPDGKPLPENEWSTPAAWRAEVKGALVTEWRVYADNEPIRQIMAKKNSQPPAPRRA